MAKFLITVALGALLGTLMGVGLVLAGVVWNVHTIPAWTVCGALIGLGHGLGHLVLEVFARWAEEENDNGF